MADNLLPNQPLLPLPPAGLNMNDLLVRYLINLIEGLNQELMTLRVHLNTRTLQGTAAERPTANGTRRFYWQTDGTPHLEFDSGSWNSV